MRRLRATVAVLLDLSLCGLAVLVIDIALRGGGQYTIGGVPIGLRSVDNPLTALFGIAFLRAACAAWAPFLNVDRLSVDSLKMKAARWLPPLDDWARTVSPGSIVRSVAMLAAASLALKVLFASIDAGFFSGDDVEIHEMTLRALLRASWPVWDLRSPVYPFIFIYPAQALAVHMGASAVSALVVAGRLLAAVISTLSLFIVWRLATVRHRDAPGYAMISVLLLASSRLFISFGSTELPRPISTVFVLLGFLLLRRSTLADTVSGGVSLGFAGSLRFSEYIFLIPAVAERLLRRQWTLAAALTATAGATAIALLGYVDRLYWGDWFHSLRAAMNFTIVNGLSSRGYQAPWWYVLNVQRWTNVAVAVLAAIGLRRNSTIALWTVLPLVCLSALPHKEARYAIPVLPFLCLLAVEGLRSVAAMSARPPSRRPWVPIALAMGLAYGFAQDLAHYRLPRSNREVTQLARVLPVVPPDRTLLVEQLWRVGGHLYLNGRSALDLDPSEARSVSKLRNHVIAKTCLFIDERTLRGSPAVREFLIARNAVALPKRPDDPYAVWLVDPD